ncbi:MAG TPA: PilZ domain-containing protein [Spirochaetia bacterium]|nr:PilZ domain-containing protein [Spirochaetia bacterium]
MAAERRIEARFSIDHMVELSFGRETFLHATGINISKTGMLCATDSYLEPYSQVSLMMTIPVGPKGHRMTCDGIVVRSEIEEKQFLAGISFTSLPEKDLKVLVSYLKNQTEIKD